MEFKLPVDLAGSTATRRMGTDPATLSTKGGQAHSELKVADFKM